MSRMTEFRQALRAEDWAKAERFYLLATELATRPDAKGRSLVGYAAQDGRWAEVRWLLARGACIEQMVSGCFMNLAAPAPADIVALLEAQLRTSAEPAVDWGPRLALAAQAGNASLCRLIMEAPQRLDGAGWQAGWFACMKNFNGEVAEAMLGSGGAVAFTGCRGSLAVACIRVRSLAGLDWLAKRGLALDEPVSGLTLLGVAAQARFAAGMQGLLRLGAAVDGRDSRGRTALYHCVAKGHEEGARMLLLAGADPEARQGLHAQGDSPVRLAAKEGSHGIRKLLTPALETVALERAMRARPAQGRVGSRL